MKLKENTPPLPHSKTHPFSKELRFYIEPSPLLAIGPHRLRHLIPRITLGTHPYTSSPYLRSIIFLHKASFSSLNPHYHLDNKAFFFFNCRFRRPNLLAHSGFCNSLHLHLMWFPRIALSFPWEISSNAIRSINHCFRHLRTPLISASWTFDM